MKARSSTLIVCATQLLGKSCGPLGSRDAWSQAQLQAVLLGRTIDFCKAIAEHEWDSWTRRASASSATTNTMPISVIEISRLHRLHAPTAGIS